MKCIKNYRERMGLTQEQLAKKAGIDRSKLSGLENGKGNPRISTLKKIAATLCCDIKDLI